jgi:hypothetical protein
MKIVKYIDDINGKEYPPDRIASFLIPVDWKEQRCPVEGKTEIFYNYLEIHIGIESLAKMLEWLMNHEPSVPALAVRRNLMMLERFKIQPEHNLDNWK